MKRNLRNWVLLAISMLVFAVIVSESNLWSVSLRFLFPGLGEVLYPRSTLVAFVTEHIELVAISSAVSILIGVGAGVFVTRSYGRDFLPLANNLTSLGQTVPPVAVIALAVPVLGFGLAPTLVALWLYGLLPVIRNTVVGLNAVPASSVDAARGMGMSGFQILWRVELPLSARVIVTGVRTSVVINIGTAMIGAVIGAGGLGSPVIAGLISNNVAFVIEGALPGAMMALIVDLALDNIEDLFSYPGSGI